MSEMKDCKEHKLSPAEAALINEYVTAINNLEYQKQGVLQLIVRTNKLQGTWMLVGDKLVKQETKK